MLEIRRDDSGNYALALPIQLLLSLRELPSFLRRVLDGEEGGELIARLFPPAYRDPAREEEYRQLLGDDLLERKRAAIENFERIVADAEVRVPLARIVIPADRFDAFLAFVNEIRVLLGLDLGIEKEGWGEDLPEDHPKLERLLMLHFLTYLEQQLLDATGMVDFEVDPEDLAEE